MLFLLHLQIEKISATHGVLKISDILNFELFAFSREKQNWSGSCILFCETAELLSLLVFFKKLHTLCPEHGPAAQLQALIANLFVTSFMQGH